MKNGKDVDGILAARFRKLLSDWWPLGLGIVAVIVTLVQGNAWITLAFATFFMSRIGVQRSEINTLKSDKRELERTAVATAADLQAFRSLLGWVWQNFDTLALYRGRLSSPAQAALRVLSVSLTATEAIQARETLAREVSLNHEHWRAEERLVREAEDLRQVRAEDRAEDAREQLMRTYYTLLFTASRLGKIADALPAEAGASYKDGLRREQDRLLLRFLRLLERQVAREAVEGVTHPFATAQGLSRLLEEIIVVQDRFVAMLRGARRHHAEKFEEILRGMPRELADELHWLIAG